MRKLIAAVLAVAAFPSAALALGASSIPTKVPTYWATGAPGGNVTCPIPIPSQIPFTAGRASWTDGFPPDTFSPVGSGGVPPSGADFNGVLCQLSQWTRWFNAGGAVPYDGSFSSAVGGYPNGAVVASVAYPGVMWRSTADNNTSDPDTSGANWTLFLGLPPSIYIGGGSANAQTVAVTGIQSLAQLQGIIFQYVPSATNTGSATLAVSGLTAQPVKKVATSGSAGLQALGGGELQSGLDTALFWDGSEFVLLNPFNAPPAIYTAGGSANAQTITIPGISSVNSLKGIIIQFFPAAANTGPTTLNVNGFGAFNLFKVNTSNSPLTALGAGELTAPGNSFPAAALFDGAEFILLNPTTPIYNQFYVSKSGTDSGSCTQSSSPCLTINYGVSRAISSCTGGAQVVVNLGTGVWDETLNVQNTSPCSGTNGGNSQLVISGNGSSNTLWNGANNQCGTLIANSGANVAIENLEIRGSQNVCQSALYAQLGGLIQVYGGVDFDGVEVAHLYCEGAGSQVQIWNNYTVSGSYNMYAHADAGGNCLIEWNPGGIVVTFSGSVTASNYFAASDNGTIFLDGPTFSPGYSSAGSTCRATLNGVVDSGGNLSRLPGTGSVTSGGGQCN